MWSRFLSVMILAPLLSAPAWAQTQQSGGQGAVNPSATLNHRVSNAEVVLYWNCTRPEPGVVRLDGVVYSPYFSDVRFLEFELVGLDPQDALVSHVTGGLPDIQLRTNQTSPFRLDLRTAGTEARFDLFYRYRSQGSLRSEGTRRVLVAATLGPEAQLLTAYGEWTTYLQAMNIGAVDYLTKPVRRHDILLTIRKGLGRRGIRSPGISSSGPEADRGTPT